MQDRFILSRLDQLRALADPLRLKLVEALVARERSVADLARAVGAPVTRLYHHVELLLEAGLIAVARRVPRRGTQERIYRAVAREYQLDGSLLDLDAGGGRSAEDLIQLGRSVLGTALEELTEGIRSGQVSPGKAGRGVVLQEQFLRLSPQAFEALARELPAWLTGFERRHKSPRGISYRLAVAAFPAPKKLR